MHKTFFALLALVLFACKGGFHQATDAEVSDAAIKMIEKRNNADGGGGWTVKNVEVLRLSKGDDERHAIARVHVQGVHKQPPLANPLPDEPIDEEVRVPLIWRDGKWILDESSAE
jgi:hypothetical protein